MNVIATTLPGVLIIEPKVFSGDRCFFLESFHAEKYREHGVVGPFVQDNWSHSVRNTLRELHYQNPFPQGKLVQVVRGAVWDIAVDIRKKSPTFGEWVGVEISEQHKRQLWIPPGFAHGFCVLSETADFLYKFTEVYRAEADAGILWNDPDLGISWPVKEPLLSGKDAKVPRLRDVTFL